MICVFLVWVLDLRVVGFCFLGWVGFCGFGRLGVLGVGWGWCNIGLVGRCVWFELGSCLWSGFVWVLGFGCVLLVVLFCFGCFCVVGCFCWLVCWFGFWVWILGFEVVSCGFVY